MRETSSYSSSNVDITEKKRKLTKTESSVSDISGNSNFSTNEKEIPSLMKNVINMIITYQNQSEGKKDEEISFLIKNSLFEINKKIYNIVDEKNNTFLHILSKLSLFFPLKIICDTYYLILDDEEVFYKWFFLENSEKLNVLDIASIRGNRQILSYLYSIIIKTNESLLKFDDINYKKNTLFHSCAKYNKYYSILFWYEKLQKYYPKTKIFDIKNANNLTPLHYACFDNSYKSAKLLIDLGANVNGADINGKSVLTYAINSNNDQLIELLLVNGADPSLKDIEGKTPYDYSLDICDKKIQLLLNNNKEISLAHNNKNNFEIIYFLLMYLFFISLIISRLFDINDFQRIFDENYIFLGLLFLFISFLSLNISFIFIFYFSCCIKYSQHIKKHKQNLLELYEKYSTDICIKCLRKQKETTHHCTLCNICIDKWKFHSFWLNACITTENITKFKLFILSIIVMLLSNIISEIFFLLYALFDEEEYKIRNNLYNNFFYFYYEEKEESKDFEEENKNIKNFCFIPFLLFFICFFSIINILIIVKIFKKNKAKKIFKYNQNINNLNYGLINDEEEENKNNNEQTITSSVGASIGD